MTVTSRPPLIHCRVVITGDDVWEDLTGATDSIRQIATDLDQVVTCESGLFRLAENQPRPEVAVLLNAGGQFTPDQQKRVDEMVREGMGLLAVHCTAFLPGFNADYPTPGADEYWRTAFNLLGLRYDSHGPQPHETRFTVHLGPNHPVTAGLADFPITHEHYHVVMADGDAAPAVIAWRDTTETTDATESDHTDGVNTTTTTPPADHTGATTEPLMTAKQWGAGRVVWLQLGHDMRAFGEPTVRDLIARALTWITEEACS